MRSRHGQRVNICFHGIGTPARELEPGEAAYWITHDTYRAVLDLVVDDPRVRLSFDDGNASDVEAGLPGLRQRGLRATFFPLAARLDQPGSVSADDLRELAAAGMTVGTHGMDHRPWRGLDPTQRRRELEEAREVIETVVDAPVTEAALPLGRYDRELLGHLRRLGYTAVHTSDRSPARHGAWLQPRFSIRSDDTVDSVRQRVLAPPPPGRRVERAVVGALKRWR